MKPKPSSQAEIKCDACNGTGAAPAREPSLGRRIYPGRCRKCGGKGRVMKTTHP
jgi:DnaJ-class molecular chaperone